MQSRDVPSLLSSALPWRGTFCDLPEDLPQHCRVRPSLAVLFLCVTEQWSRRSGRTVTSEARAL